MAQPRLPPRLKGHREYQGLRGQPDLLEHRDLRGHLEPLARQDLLDRKGLRVQLVQRDLRERPAQLGRRGPQGLQVRPPWEQ